MAKRGDKRGGTGKRKPKAPPRFSPPTKIPGKKAQRERVERLRQERGRSPRRIRADLVGRLRGIIERATGESWEQELQAPAAERPGRDDGSPSWPGWDIVVKFTARTSTDYLGLVAAFEAIEADAVLERAWGGRSAVGKNVFSDPESRMQDEELFLANADLWGTFVRQARRQLEEYAERYAETEVTALEFWIGDRDLGELRRHRRRKGQRSR